MTDHPAPETPTRRERLGGRWAISWQATVLGSVVIVAVVTLAGTSVGASPVSADQIGRWLLSSIVGALAISAYTLVAHLTVFRHRVVRPVPVPIVVVFHLGLGAVFAVAVSATAHTLGLVDSPLRATTLVGFALGALVWCLTVTTLLDSRDRFRRERAALLDEAVTREGQQLQEMAVMTSLGGLLATADGAAGTLPGAPRETSAHSPDAGLVPLDDWWRMSATLQTSAGDEDAAVDRLLREAAERRYPEPGLRSVLRRGLVRQRFSWPILAAVVALAYWPDAASRDGSAGLIASVGLAACIAGVLALANLLVTRGPAGLGFWVGFVAAQGLAVAFLHGYDVLWLASLWFSGIEVPVPAPVPVPLNETLASVVLLGAAIGITSGRRVLQDQRATYLTDFRAEADAAAGRQRIAITDLADLARRAGAAAAPDRVPTLVTVATLLDRASQEEDGQVRQQLLQEAADLTAAPAEAAGDVLAQLHQVIEPWRVVATIDLRTQDDLARLPESVHGQVVRVVEEAVTNACRHGQAGQIDVRVDIEQVAPAGITVSVIDDGIGLVPNPVLGLGSTLFGEASAGDYSLTPRPDGPGTVLTLHLPFD